MQKTRIQYDSPVDALVALVKRLGRFEEKYGMSSERFYEGYMAGKTDDSEDSVDWANDYRHSIALKGQVR